jgi:cytochrome c
LKEIIKFLSLQSAFQMFSKFPDFLLIVSSSGLCLFLIFAYGGRDDERAGGIEQTANTPPVVRINEPKEDSVHPLNSLVRYSISVSDKEDGESRYDEIPSEKIFMELEFIAGSPKKGSEKTKNRGQEPAGLRAIKSSDCFSCHQFKTRLIGPSFNEIATRYAGTSNARELLADRITGGSRAVWGEAIMPAHPDVSLETSREIAGWILSTGLNKNVNYIAGKEGTFRLDLPAGGRTGFFILKATYTDKGIEGQPHSNLPGEDVLTIRSK